MAGASKMQAQVELLSKCRFCGSPHPIPFLETPPLPITGAFLKSAHEAEFLYPIKLYLCESCLVVQSQHNISFSEYYEDYAYTMAASGFARHFAAELARTVVETWRLKPGSRVLEIGSADGIQLQSFRDLGMQVYGFEPSYVLSDAARTAGIPTTTGLFGKDTVEQIPADMKPFQLVLLTHVFDHLPYPGEFCETLTSLLDPNDGLLLIEVHNFEETIEFVEYPLLQHEHTTYPTAASFQRMFDLMGLELLDVGVLPPEVKRAHSLMVLATRKGSSYSERALPPLRLGPVGSLSTLRDFDRRLHETLGRVRDYIAARRRADLTLAGFGGGGRGIMTLAATAQAGDLRYVCDSSPAHHGQFMPGSHIPVVAPEQADLEPVDEIIVFSYGYLEEIKKQLANHTARGGTITSLLDILSPKD